MRIILPLTLTLASATAFAADPAADSSAAATTAPADDTQHEMAFRARSMSVPKFILDNWLYDGVDQGQPRPDATAFALGIEYTLQKEASRFTFYAEHVGTGMEGGVWDDNQDAFGDGDFLLPSDNFGFVALGTDFGHDFQLVRTDMTNGVFGLSIVPSAGLGALITTGELQQWETLDPNVESQRGYSRYAANPENPDGAIDLWPVYPLIDVNVGLNFNFGDRVVARVEGGLHTMLYYGGSVGVVF
jgi:hypothetical protein